MVETADDLELDGLDYTRKPGVEGAGIESVDPVPAQPRESDGSDRVPITESAPEATVTISEADVKPSQADRALLEVLGILRHDFVDGACRSCGY
jgi:hypothetical protein